MTYAAFFKSSSFRYGCGAGLVTAGIGTVGTLLAAFDLASRCSSLVRACESIVDESITIPKLTCEVDVNSYPTSIAIYNIETPFPPEWAEIINKLNVFPAYCLNVPMTVGLTLTLMVSVTVASCVMNAVHTKEQYAKNDNQEDYLLLASV